MKEMSKKACIAGILFLLIFLCVPRTAITQAEQKPESLEQKRVVLTKISDDEVENIIRSLGFEYKATKYGEVGKPIYGANIFSLRGYNRVYTNCLVVNYESKLEVIFQTDTKLSLSRINEWNKKSDNGALAYRADNTVVIKAYLNLIGGVTKENVQEFIRNFGKSLDSFPLSGND